MHAEREQNGSPKAEILYRDQHLLCDLPSGWHLQQSIKPNSIEPVTSFSTRIDEAAHAIAGSISSGATEHGRKVALVVDDNTRPTPANLIVPPIIEELNRIGIPDEQIVVVIANGMHTGMDEQNLIRKLGEETVRRVAIENHTPDRHISYLGTSSRGATVSLNTTVVEAGFKIAVGTNAMHLLGYGGGPKIVMPGIAARETINDFHYLALVEKKSRWGNLESNPMWRDMCEVAAMIDFEVVVNVVYNANGEIVELLWGKPEEVSKKAKAILDRMYSIELAGIADVAIASGSPLDNCLFQGLKGAFAAGHFVKPGGTIILAAPSDQGLGPYTDGSGRNLLELDGPSILEGMKGHSVNPSAAITPYLLRELLEEKRLIVVSDALTADELGRIGVEYAETLNSAVKEVSDNNPHAHVVVLPKGSSMLGTSRSTAMTVGLYPEKE